MSEFILTHSSFLWLVYLLLYGFAYTKLVVLLGLAGAWPLLDIVSKHKSLKSQNHLTFPSSMMITISVLPAGVFVSGVFIYAAILFFKEDFAMLTMRLTWDGQVHLTLNYIWFFALFFAVLIPLLCRKIKLIDLWLSYSRKLRIPIYLLLIFVLLLIVAIVNIGGVHFAQHQLLEQLFGMPTAPKLLFIFLMVVIAPLMEELLSRGYIYLALRERIGIFGGILVTSFLFALMHPTYVSFGYIFIVGCVFNSVNEYYKSLYPSIFLHVAVNFIFVLIYMNG